MTWYTRTLRRVVTQVLGALTGGSGLHRSSDATGTTVPVEAGNSPLQETIARIKVQWAVRAGW